jgi:hypothetical protein
LTASSTASGSFPRLATSIRLQWPTTANGKLDMSRAPFKLISIVNRMDLHAGSNGETRFVYGLFDLNGNGMLMTVIFEYGLPDKDPNTGATLTRKSWASKFHALGTKTFGTQYNAALQAVTGSVHAAEHEPVEAGRQLDQPGAQQRDPDGAALAAARVSPRQHRRAAGAAPLDDRQHAGQRGPTGPTSRRTLCSPATSTPTPS